MSPELLSLGMFGLLLIAIILGVSLSFALGGIAVIFALILSGPMGLFSIVSSTFSSMWSVLLAAIPLFVLMGVALARSTISSDLYRAFYLWSGRLNGGLLIGTAGFASVLSAMTGSCAASTLTTGMVGIPAMERHGYDRAFMLGTIGAAGTLGIIIPPSITLIVIGMTTGVSVGALFMGGLVAGIFILLAIIIYIAIKSWLRPDLAPSTGERVPMREKLASLKSVVAPLTIIFVVLASIFMGIATPTEAAAVGAAAVMLAVALRGEVNMKFICEVSYSTATTTGMVMWIVFGASAFVSIYSGAGGIDFVQNILLSLEVDPWVLMAIMQLFALLLGMFLDPLGIILLAMPIFFPVASSLGFDPLWFAIIFQINLCIGYITPPFGYNIFYLKSMSPGISIWEIYKSVIPFVILMISCGIVFMVFPDLLLVPTSLLLGE